MTSQLKTARQLNDELRTGNYVKGLVKMTPGIIALGPLAVIKIRAAVAKFIDFKSEEDPLDEHSFGVLDYGHEKVLFKINYFSSIHTRVLKIMLFSEY